MQRTAGRAAVPLSMTSTFNQQPRVVSVAVAHPCLVRLKQMQDMKQYERSAARQR